MRGNYHEKSQGKTPNTEHRTQVAKVASLFFERRGSGGQRGFLRGFDRFFPKWKIYSLNA
ncbi:MAG TPA: hypothetical protein DDW56_23580 [Cyanobacteria bacterium UBA11366]|nr:hypothetical protein [Cyanobacteria bacterium UBA11366]